MLKVKTEEGNEAYVILSGKSEEGFIGIVQCKHCTETTFIPYAEDDVMANFIINFIDTHKCRATKPVTKQMLLSQIRKIYGKN